VAGDDEGTSRAWGSLDRWLETPQQRRSDDGHEEVTSLEAQAAEGAGETSLERGEDEGEGAREEGWAAVSQPGGQYGDREKEANAEAQMRSGREALET
jgi:hypothetical protein